MAYLGWLNSGGEINRLELEPLGHSYTLSDTLKQIETSEMGGLAGHQFMERFWWDGTEWVLRGDRPNSFSTWNTETNSWNKNEAALLIEIKRLRNVRLQDCDWVGLWDHKLDSDNVGLAVAYRQTLRDFPTTLDMSSVDSVDDVTWPTIPDCLL